MARTNKIGIDYFPFDVDFFHDDKIQLIEAEFGVKGGYIAIRLLCKIYREGYFYQWGSDECLLFAKNMGADGVSKGFIGEVIAGLVKRGFFDKSVFDKFCILTSAGIQRRYFEATKRYQTVDAVKEYLLVDVSKQPNVNIVLINANINPNNGDTNPQKKGKEKEKKENTSAPASENFKKFQKWIDDNAPNVAKLRDPFTENEFVRLKADFGIEYIQTLLSQMHNYKPLLTKYQSANLTFRSWAKRDSGAAPAAETTTKHRVL